jgi:DNA-binding FadR family transcriptional regulator
MVQLAPLRTESLKDAFVARFEDLILSGRFAIGERLPPERELALQLGVSRPIVHEGLVDLAFKGLISMKPRVGAVVNDYRTEGSLALLTSLMSYREAAIEPRLLVSALEVRRLIETETARLAARHHRAEHLEFFARALAAEETIDPADAARVADLDFAFHHQIALASGNQVYPLVLNTFKKFYTNLSARFFADPTVCAKVFGFHRGLVAAIERRDPAGAVRVMDRLLAHGEARLRQIGLLAKGPRR